MNEYFRKHVEQYGAELNRIKDLIDEVGAPHLLVEVIVPQDLSDASGLQDFFIQVSGRVVVDRDNNTWVTQKAKALVSQDGLYLTLHPVKYKRFSGLQPKASPRRIGMGAITAKKLQEWLTFVWAFEKLWEQEQDEISRLRKEAKDLWLSLPGEPHGEDTYRNVYWVKRGDFELSIFRDDPKDIELVLHGTHGEKALKIFNLIPQGGL